MNMLRHKKTCKSNIENHFAQKEKKVKEDIEYQRKLLIQDFKKLNLEKVAQEISGLSNSKIKQNLIEYISIAKSIINKDNRGNSSVNLEGSK